jgi:hypothetical protein
MTQWPSCWSASTPSTVNAARQRQQQRQQQQRQRRRRRSGGIALAICNCSTSASVHVAGDGPYIARSPTGRRRCDSRKQFSVAGSARAHEAECGTETEELREGRGRKSYKRKGIYGDTCASERRTVGELRNASVTIGREPERRLSDAETARWSMCPVRRATVISCFMRWWRNASASRHPISPKRIQPTSE